MKNNENLINSLNSAVSKADQAIRASAAGRPSHTAQAEAINKLVKVITLLDERIVALEEKISSQT